VLNRGRMLGCALLVAVSTTGQINSQKKGYVPDAETAVKIAETRLILMYGAKQIASEEPFQADLKDRIWTVWGTLRCPDGRGGTTNVCVGGVARARVRQSDGRVLSMTHTE
jgi:hypothetical protein